VGTEPDDAERAVGPKRPPGLGGLGPGRRSVAWVSAALAAPALAVAWAARPKWRPGLGERLGRIRSEAPGPIWVHGASVGEAGAALRLIDELERRGRSVRASTTTVTGRDLLRGARPGLAATLAPLDHPLAVEAALRRTRPVALALVETELWPCWIAGAQRHGVPVVVVSGRLSDRSLPRYRRFRRVLGPTLARLAAVGARSEEDARRFASLGVPTGRITVTGDLKLEPSPPQELASDLGVRLAATPLLVAGSTHEGEEAAALDAFAQVCAEGLAAALVLAPRHPERFERVARELDARSFPWQRRSTASAAPVASGEVLLLDSVGELAAVFGRSLAAFVGGSLAPGVGGHNVLEPIFASRPVSFGPYTPNAREAVALALQSGAGEVVSDAKTLAAAWMRDLRDPRAAAARGAAGVEALEPHQGAARRAADQIEAAIAAVGASSSAPGGGR